MTTTCVQSSRRDPSDPQSLSTANTRSVIPWRRRADLIVKQQDSGAWIVKDPLSLSCSLLDEKEMAVFRLLDGTRSIQELLATLHAAWPDDDLEKNDIEHLIGQFVHNQFLLRTNASVLPTNPSGANPSGSNTNAKWLALFRISSLLRIQIPLVNPSRLLTAAEPLIARIFSPATAMAFAALVTTAILMVVLRFDWFVSHLPGPWDFFETDNLLLLFATFIAVKMMHEVGHAFAARRFGAECHEAGVMLLLFTPILYTNVTDAWMLDRRSRLLITAAGILVEVSLAAIATILWFFAAPGVFKALLANVMILCTVSTVLFNGNPLLRYDGYFLLTDTLSEINLAQRASRRMQMFFENILLGRRDDDITEETWFVTAYGLCSAAYRTLLTFTILVMLFKLFDHWNLRIAGILLMVAAAYSMVATPMVAAMTGLLAELFDRDRRGWRAFRASIVATILLVCLFIPLPHTVVVPGVVEPAGTPIFATLSGELVESAAYGQVVSPETVVAVLNDLSLRKQAEHLVGEVRMHESRIRAMELSRNATLAAQLPEAKQLLAAASKRLAQFEEEEKRLTVRGAVRGQLLPPRAISNSLDDQVLSQWRGCPLEIRNLGAKIEEGTLLGYVCDPMEVEILVTLPNDQRQLVERGQMAAFQSNGNPNLVLQGTMHQLASLEIDEVPAELTAAGLLAPITSTRQGVVDRHWQATLRGVVPSSHNRPPLYSTGWVRIQVAPSSLASRFASMLRTTFR